MTKLRDRARAAMIGKLIKGPSTGICVDVDYEHIIYPDRGPRFDLDSGLVVKIEVGHSDFATYWLHLKGPFKWEIYGEGEFIP